MYNVEIQGSEELKLDVLMSCPQEAEEAGDHKSKVSLGYILCQSINQ